MPLIPNYISRFRTQSQSTAATSNTSQSGSHSTATTLDPPTPVPGPTPLGPDRLSTDEPAAGATLKPIDELVRKLHPDLNALISEIEAQPAEASGLRPPRRKSRSAGQLTAKKPEPVVDNDKPGDRHDSQTGESAGAPASPRSPFLSRILSTPILGGLRSSSPASDNNDSKAAESDPHWSTFGRRRLRMPQVGEFGSLRRRESGSRSPNSKSSNRRFPRSSASFSTTRPLSEAQTAPSSTGSQPSQADSPIGTLSSSGSKSYSQNSHLTRPRHTLGFPEPIPDDGGPSTPTRSPLSMSSPSPDGVIHADASPQPTHPFLDDSPNTFGRRPTPKRPAITADSRQEVFFTPSRTSTPPPPERLYRPEPPDTYPPRSRKRTLDNFGSVSFPSFHIGAATSSPSRTRAEDIFLEPGNEASRRISADWSATEALIKDNNSTESWPATVSREMVRLSLGSRDGRNNAAGSVGTVGSISETEETGALQASDNKNPTLFGSVGQDRRLFLRAARRKTAPSIAAALASASQQSNPTQPLIPASSEASVSKIKIGTRSGSLIPRVSFTRPSPITTSGSRMGTLSDPGPSPPDRGLDDNVSASIGKRKMNESEDELPMAQIGTKSILLTRNESSNRPSDASHAPSSFRQPKRIRLSTPPHDQSLRSISPHQTPPGSPISRPPSSFRTSPNVNPRSSSQSSIPFRAIISPKPPSIDRRSVYHMRDPDLPPPQRQSSQWTGGARKLGEDGRRMFPLQGWAFIVGFLFFPLWWLAAILPVRLGWGRRVGSQDGKGVWTEEELALRETLEYDVAYAWRKRCRIMSFLGLFVYVPIIVLLAVFVPRT
ncbi:hypothetical protein BU17DRAFT_82519 [Hysterangium stoloniferum]|nr:hypothetical protein BU17DRAFT_82519 [Hysterangium stoloniferum]